MTTRDGRRIRSEILGEANRWFIELNEHPQDEATRRRFDHWLRRSPEHVHAFLLVSAHWEESAPRSNVAVESVDELVALAKSDSDVVALASAIRLPSDRTDAFADTGAKPLRVRSRRIMLAACVLLSIGAAFVWQQFFRGTYATDIGEQRSIGLADGSTVELNSQTRIRVRFTKRERHIELLEGQALFQVAKNEAQPFIVRSGNTQVRAIGTQFDVYRKQNGTVVTVVEGRVSVRPVLDENGGSGSAAPSDAVQEAKFLDGGQQLTLGVDAASVAIAHLAPADLEAATAWTDRRLIFKATPLAEVVDEFNRYSERPIVVDDPEIAAIPISGVFSSSDPTDLLRFLREVGAYEVHETRSAIEVSRRAQ